MRSYVNKTMTITAIHSELSDMYIMWERNRLNWLIANPRILGRNVIPSPRGQTANDRNAAYRYF